MKTKKTKKSKATKATKVSKKDRLAAREAKKAARKGDGSFPDVLVVHGNGDGGFIGHNAEDLSGLSNDGATVAVYKLRRVSTISIKRKVVR